MKLDGLRNKVALAILACANIQVLETKDASERTKTFLICERPFRVLSLRNFPTKNTFSR